MNPVAAVVLYLGVLASATWRAWRRAHPLRDYGRAGWDENPDEALDAAFETKIAVVDAVLLCMFAPAATIALGVVGYVAVCGVLGALGL